MSSQSLEEFHMNVVSMKQDLSKGNLPRRKGNFVACKGGFYPKSYNGCRECPLCRLFPMFMDSSMHYSTLYGVVFGEHMGLYKSLIFLIGNVERCCRALIGQLLKG